MTTKVWVGGAIGAPTWDNIADWSPQGEPAATDDVVLGAGAAVTIASGTVQAGTVSLTDPTASLTVDGILQNTTVQFQGGQLAGTGALDDDTIVGTLTTNSLTVEQTLTLDSASGQPDLVITGPGSAVSAVGMSELDGGIALVGSTDASRPVVFQGSDTQFTLDVTLDVTGATVLESSGPGADVANVVSVGPINVAPGGDLVFQREATTIDLLHVASGTIDLSSAAFAPTVTFDDAGGKLILNNFAFPTVAGFRAGDTIDIKGVSVSGTFAPNSSGTIVVGEDQITLKGSTAPDATYTAAPDGTGGTLVTTTAQPAATAAFTDQTTGATGSHPLDAASGGPSYLQWQYLDSGADTVAITASTPDVFLKGGSGTKALAVTSGQNVLDGGTGSAFLAGGSGTDTFFVDIRGGSSTWDTLTNFHAGDAVTVWGWVPGVSTETVDAQAGAAGYQGATLCLANGEFGGQTSSVTFAGLSAGQVAHLQTATGTVGGVSYLNLYNPGV